MTSKASRTQLEASTLSGSGPGTNPVTKSRVMVSSWRQFRSLACSSGDSGPGPLRAKAKSSGLSPMQPSSALDRADCKEVESCRTMGASLPSGVGSDVGELACAGVAAAVVVAESRPPVPGYSLVAVWPRQCWLGPLSRSEPGLALTRCRPAGPSGWRR